MADQTRPAVLFKPEDVAAVEAALRNNANALPIFRLDALAALVEAIAAAIIKAGTDA